MSWFRKEQARYQTFTWKSAWHKELISIVIKSSVYFLSGGSGRMIQFQASRDSGIYNFTHWRRPFPCPCDNNSLLIHYRETVHSNRNNIISGYVQVDSAGDSIIISKLLQCYFRIKLQLPADVVDLNFKTTCLDTLRKRRYVPWHLFDVRYHISLNLSSYFQHMEYVSLDALCAFNDSVSGKMLPTNNAKSNHESEYFWEC